MIEEQESLHFLDYWRVIRSRKEVIIAVSLLVVLTGILVTFAMPKVYQASTIIAVRQESPDVEVFTRHVTGYDPYFMRTQFEIIQSRPIVEETVRKLDLDAKLGAAYGYGHLDDRYDRTIKLISRSMKVQQYRDTNLIEIQMHLAEPKETANAEAANVANAIASVFRDQRIRVSREEADRAMRALFASLQDHEKKVSEAEKLVEDIRTKYEINVVGTAGGADVTIDKMGLQQLEAYRRKTRVDLAEKESRLSEITALSAAELVDAAPILGDEVLANLSAQRRTIQVEKSRLLESYGPKHPKVLDAQAVIESLERKIADAIEGLKTGTRVAYRTEKAKLDIIEAELEELKQRERGHESGSYREFERATEELRHARMIRDSLEARYLQEQIEMSIPRTIVEVVSPAHAPSVADPVSPNIMLNVLLSILVGLGSGIGLAYFIEYLDTSVKTVEEVERLMQVQVVGVIPQKVLPLNDEEAVASHAEAYRILRTNIRFSKRLGGGKTVTVTSGSSGEGKSLTLFNLAYVAARLGERVLMVDSDLHRPTLHKLAGISQKPGLANVLVGEKDVESCIAETKIANLYLLPSGKLSSGHHGLLDTVRMKELIAKLKSSSYDLILFDTPPITGVSDASLLAREMDGVVLVIRHRKYPRTIANRAKALVENVGGNLVGAVLNNVNVSRDYSYYYYGHYYTYSYGKTRNVAGQAQTK